MKNIKFLLFIFCLVFSMNVIFFNWSFATLYILKDQEGNDIWLTNNESLVSKYEKLGYAIWILKAVGLFKKSPEPELIDYESQTKTGWHEISRWQGKSTKNTETFRIPTNEWRISWNTKPGEYGDMNFIISAYKPPSELPDVVANVIGRDTDSSIMRGAGDYYLSINTAQQYEVIVEAKY